MNNKTIGIVTCPFCLEPAAVRKNKNGKFYYISKAGLITPSGDFGQEWFAENATMWGEEGEPPDGTPAWIVENKSNPPNTTSRIARRRPDPDPDPPEPETFTLPDQVEDDELEDEPKPADTGAGFF